MNKVSTYIQSMAMAALLALALPLTSVAPRVDTPSDTDEIRWTASKRLSWSDFKGRPDHATEMDALTESGISFSWSCDNRGFRAQAYAMFVPAKSWVKTPTPRLLAHEQVHFDITELHARKLRKYFADMRNPCWLGKDGINEAARRHIRDNRTMQEQYDRETNHSIREGEQKRWEAKVSAELAAYAAYAEP